MHLLQIPEFSDHSFVPKHFFLNAFDFKGTLTIRKSFFEGLKDLGRGRGMLGGRGESWEVEL